MIDTCHTFVKTIRLNRGGKGGDGMLSKGIFNTLSKPLGCLSMALGVFFLSMKLVREYIHIFRPYSFELFLLGPIFLLIGFRLVCRDVKFKLLRISSSLLFGVAIIYFILLSFGWYSINIM